MATIEGNHIWEYKQELKKYAFLAVVVSITMSSVMIFYSNNIASELGTVVVLTLCCAGFIGLICFRSNPMIWKRYFQKELFASAVKRETEVTESLAALDENTFVFNNFIFELFRIEHLVISSQGLFIIHKLSNDNALHVTNNSLFAGNHSLESDTSNLWRACHLINIVLKKTFKEEILPTPILLTSNEAEPMKKFDGISIMNLAEFHQRMNKSKTEPINPVLIKSFAGMVKNRYLSH